MVVRFASAFFVVGSKSSKKRRSHWWGRSDLFLEKKKLVQQVKVKRTFKSGGTPKFEPLKDKRKFEPLKANETKFIPFKSKFSI